MPRILVVDDSAFMRKAISMLLEKAPDFEVVGTARDGQEALDLVDRLDPDLVTMDVEMPRMDGLTALRHLMQRSPRPVIMISSLTQEGAATTVEALSAGAVDFIPKEHASVSLSITDIEDTLHRKVRVAALARRRLARFGGSFRARPQATASAAVNARQAEVLVIGVSTGGPLALQELLPTLPATFPVPIAIVQHMPPHFTRSLAERLDAKSALTVREAEHGMLLERGHVLIARGGEHLALRRNPLDRSVSAVLSPEPSALLHRPSVDVLFESATKVYGRNVLGLVMTGMGKDGLEGARAITEAGGSMLAQDEASSVVYGMPRAVTEAGLTAASVPLSGMADALAKALGRSARPATARTPA